LKGIRKASKLVSVHFVVAMGNSRWQIFDTTEVVIDNMDETQLMTHVMFTWNHDENKTNTWKKFKPR